MLLCLNPWRRQAQQQSTCQPLNTVFILPNNLEKNMTNKQPLAVLHMIITSIEGGLRDTKETESST